MAASSDRSWRRSPDVGSPAAARPLGNTTFADRDLRCARGPHGRLRRRADGDGRVPDLARRRAARRPFADDGDRRGAVLRPHTPACTLRRPALVARPRAPWPRSMSAPASTRASSRSHRPGSRAFRSDDLVTRMVGDVDALQGLYLRGVGPALVALAAGAVCVGAMAAFLPVAGARARHRALVLGGVVVPLVAGRLGRASRPSSGSRPGRAHRRDRGAPARGARARRLRRAGSCARARRVARPRARPPRPPRCARRRPRLTACRPSLRV